MARRGNYLFFGFTPEEWPGNEAVGSTDESYAFANDGDSIYSGGWIGNSGQVLPSTAPNAPDAPRRHVGTMGGCRDHGRTGVPP